MSSTASTTRRVRPTSRAVGSAPPQRPGSDPCAGAIPWHGGLRCRAVLIVTHDGQKVLGPRFVRLLLGIEAQGSIRRATQELGLGYRHAIAWIQRAEAALDRPLVARHAGGGRSGGASLTAEARALIDAYQGVADRITDVLADAEARFFPAAPRRANPKRAR